MHTYPDCAIDLKVLDVRPETSVDEAAAQARALLSRPAGEPALIFTDVFGATPCNAAIRLLDEPSTRVVAGVNVPMLWRTLCYGTRESLDDLVARAVAGATQGAMRVDAAPPSGDDTAPR